MPERGSKTSTVPVVWATYGIFFRRDPNDFLSWFVAMDETWLYITMYRRQSNNQWSGGIAAHPDPKNYECKNPLENFSLRFFGIKTASSLIIFQKAKLSTRSITHLCWCIWRTFRKKNAAGRSPRWSCSCTTMPRLTGHLQPRKTAYLGFQFLDHTPYSPDLTPSDYHLFPGLDKQLKVRHFSSDAEVIADAETWLDGQQSEFLFYFLSCLQKLEQRAKKCIELREEDVE